MKNNKEFTAEQMLLLMKGITKANAEFNRSENKSANICRIAEVERWVNLLTVPGFEEYSNYEVSTFGNIRKHPIGKDFTDKKLSKDKDGYLQVGLTTNKKSKKFKIHRIVASAFCENDDPENKTQVNHVNHRKSDNFFRNLTYCSPKENIQAFLNYDLEKVDNINRKRSEVMKVKMLGENHPMFGKKLSDETRKKMSESRSGENNPMFGKRGENNPNFGKKYKKKLKAS